MHLIVSGPLLLMTAMDLNSTTALPFQIHILNHNSAALMRLYLEFHLINKKFNSLLVFIGLLKKIIVYF